MTTSPERFERARQSRDRRFDGRFFIGVVTTGIYCRPICPVKPPRPQNVRFYPSAAAAQQAGFRPCRRCRPETSPGTPAWLGSSATVSRALRLIAQGALDQGGVDALAARLGIGARHLRRLFAEHLGASPLAVSSTRRVHFARRLIDETHLPMSDVAHASGFGSIRQFNHAVRATFGRAPSALRARAARDAETGGPIRLRLAYRPPFDWPALVDFLAARATPGVESVDASAYRRVVELGGALRVLRVTHDADAAQLVLELEGADPPHLMRAVERVRHLFDLGADPMTIAEHLGEDAELAPRIRARPGIRVPGAWDAFELAVRAVLGQQVSVRGATTLAGRLARSFGKPLERSACNGLSHGFPTPAVLAEADVASIGLPASRAATIRRLAAAVASGELRLEGVGDTDQTLAALESLPGIGPWTAQYVAMRALGEPDSFPHGDLGLRRALGRDRAPLASAAVARRAEAWRPWRAYAALWLWTVPSTATGTRGG